MSASFSVLFSVLLLSFGRCSAYGKTIENCATVKGVWYSQLGSQLILSVHKDDTLEGEYRTSVEVEYGDAGESHSIVVGTAPKTPGAAFGFSVVWRQGRSTTIWTAQCVVCLGGHEKLLTTWLLHSQSSMCDDKWKASRIGRDIFTRHQKKVGPEKAKNTHVPERPANYTPSSDKSMKPLVKLSNLPESWEPGIQENTDTRWKKHDSDGFYMNWAKAKHNKLSRVGKVRHRQHRPSAATKPATPSCKLGGTWYNELGSEVILKQDETNVIKGEYRTAVEQSVGAAGNTHSLVHGIGYYHDPNSTFGFHVVWRNGESVTGFVGQCHTTCEKETMETLELTWILWQSIDKCQDHWRSTLFGVNTFTRYEQAAGPRKAEDVHTPNRAGEDVEPIEPVSASCYHGAFISLLFICLWAAL